MVQSPHSRDLFSVFLKLIRQIMNHTDELKFALQVKRQLNQSMHDLTADQSERLRAARERALAHQRRAPAMLALASSGGSGQFRFGWLGQLAPAVVLLGGLAGIHFWHQSQLAAEIADIDTQMLLDELPPNAYLDKGFGAWLVPPTK